MISVDPSLIHAVRCRKTDIVTVQKCVICQQQSSKRFEFKNATLFNIFIHLKDKKPIKQNYISISNNRISHIQSQWDGI